MIQHRHRYKAIFPCLWVLIICLLVSSCKKDSYITSSDALISISADSLKYDTVFTSIGSITQSFKINNPNNQKLLLSSVKLMGGNASAFRVDVNGSDSPEAQGVEIAPEDSIYIFVTVNINPNSFNLPFVVRDSIQIAFNGNTRYVQLEAFGQNANFLRDRVIKGVVRWTNNLPYVILGSLQVDEAASLTIEHGCRIYSHADAPFIIDGSLRVNGTKQEPVIFSGDRLDEGYRNLPASWPGIYFRRTSGDNVLTHTIIRNAYQALVAEQPSINSQPKLVISRSIIDNAFDAAIVCVNSSLQADNCLLSNCGKAIDISYGGNYYFSNCTAAAYPYLIAHMSPLVPVANFVSGSGTHLTADLDARFQNCIFWAEEAGVDDEVTILREGSGIFNVSLENCLYRSKHEPTNASLDAVLNNQPPRFDSINVAKRCYDFRVSDARAPGMDKGSVTGFVKDLDDNDRNIGLPDLGCYENNSRLVEIFQQLHLLAGNRLFLYPDG